MGQGPRSLVAAVGALATLAAGPVPAAGPLPVACSAAQPVIAPGEVAVLRAWAVPVGRHRPRYVWTAPIGRLEGEAAEARWDLTDVRPGTYAAAVTVSYPAHEPAECVVRVVVRRDAGSRGPGDPARETGWSFLLPATSEPPGYGLYTYLLLGAPPGEGARERHRKVVEAYLELVPALVELERYVPRASLNVAYLPVRMSPGETVSADRVLDRYDHARARSLLRLLPGDRRDGPYLVSTLTPLGAAVNAPSRYLVQDLSAVPPHLATTWVKEFLNQTAQERFWEERTAQALAMRLRLTVSVLAAGLPEVRQALDSWISWIR
jgi:hypothetical protein